MLAYLIILTASVTGLTGGAPWVIPASAVLLFSVSHIRCADLYQRGRNVGQFAAIDDTKIRSALNAIFATGLAYGVGFLLHNV